MDYPLDSSEIGTKVIKQIHPLNAAFLIDALPNRQYANDVGGILTFNTHPLTEPDTKTLHTRGCIVGMLHRDGDGEICTETCIITSQGEIFRTSPENEVMRTRLKLDIFYILLNPVSSFNNWVLQEVKQAKQRMCGIESTPGQNEELEKIIEQVRVRFAEMYFPKQ